MKTNRYLFIRAYKVIAIIIIQMLLLLIICSSAIATEEGYTQYKDPQGRFTIDYPATMKIQRLSPDEIKIFHPEATLRIHVSIEKRPKKGAPDAQIHLAALKTKLKEDMKDVVILEEGKVPKITGAQGYIICSFRDSRGTRVVQLVQYYIADERLLRLIVSDKPQGFKNLEKVIRSIHHSLRILTPELK